MYKNNRHLFPYLILLPRTYTAIILRSSPEYINFWSFSSSVYRDSFNELSSAAKSMMSASNSLFGAKLPTL